MEKIYSHFGTGLMVAIFLAAVFAALVAFLDKEDSMPRVFAANVTSTVIVGNAAPTVTNVVLNNASSIVLTANQTTNVSVNATISDNNGCADITGGTTTIMIYRSSITSSTCLTTQSNLNCYLASSFSASSTCAGGTVNTTTTLAVQYFADATDSSSSYSTQNWLATVMFRDPQNGTGTADSTGQELLTLNALNINTSSLNYGTVSPGENTGQTNQSAYVQNAGNSTTTLSLSGNSLSFGSNKLSTSSQHYATTTFTYGTSNEQALSDVLTTVSGFQISNPLIKFPEVPSWATSTALPFRDYYHPSFAYNGYAYVVGGVANGTGTSTVVFGPISSTGSISYWTSTTQLPFTDYDHPSFAYNGYAYVVGGWANGAATSTVIFTPLFSKPTYWGIGVATGTATGTYSGTNIFTVGWQQ
jgi:hypothetical protein